MDVPNDRNSNLPHKTMPTRSAAWFSYFSGRGQKFRTHALRTQVVPTLPSVSHGSATDNDACMTLDSLTYSLQFACDY